MFTTEVSMKCTKEQYEKDLKAKLIKMGYKYSNYCWEDCEYFITQESSMFPNQSSVEFGGKYYIDHYNPELFLALASMTDDKEFKIGDWIMETWKESPYYNKTPFQIVEIRTPNIRYSREENTGNDYCQTLRKATKEEIINHFTKENKIMENRFPFKLSVEQAKRIINIACSFWKDKLANLWSKDFILYEYTVITEEFYKEMRKACTQSQHELFDEIFGEDEKEKCPYEIGDIIVYNGKEFLEIVTIKDDSTHKWWINHKPCIKSNTSFSGGGFGYNPFKDKLRKATQEELENLCPYKDGELILVKDGCDYNWIILPSTGKLLNNKVQTYSFQNYDEYSPKVTWEYDHSLPKGFKLPE